MGFHPYGYVALAGVLLTGLSGIEYKRLSRYRVDLAGLYLVILTWLLFVSAFITDNFNLLAVYGYSTKDMPIWLKISASWAGMAGSFILWGLMMAVISLYYRFHGMHRGAFDEKVYRGLLLVTASVTLLSIEVGAFETADVDFKIPAGAGLNPLLRSFWILVHPLFTFAGYAFTLALALHVLLSTKRDPIWERALAGLAWINLSIGIIAGAVWAYNVLGWGGYWAWDPVETAELVPWLALTAYFHSTPAMGDGARRLSASLAGFFTFYSSFMTKAGASFTASVHTFEWTPKTTLLVALHFLFGGAILALYAWKPGSLKWSINKNVSSIAFTIAWWSLVGLSLVTFMGIFTPVVYAVATGNLISVDINYYNTYTAPLVYAFLLALIGCSIGHKIKLNEYNLVVVGVFTTSLVSAFILKPTSNVIGDFLLPAIASSLIAAVYYFAKIIPRPRLGSLGVSVLHFAIPLILLGVVLNTTLDTSTIVRLEHGKPVETPYGVTLTYKGYEIRVADWEIFYKGHLIPEGAYGNFVFDVRDGDKSYTLVLPVRVPFAYGCGSEPRTITHGLDDIYVSIIHADFHNRLRNIILENAFYGGNTTVDYVMVEVKYNPYVGLVWIGSALLVLGEVLALISLASSRGVYRFGGAEG